MRAVEKLLTTKRLLAHISRDYAPVAMHQTFCPEDIVLAHLIYSDLVHAEFQNIQMFFVDTGQTGDDVYLAMERMQQRYGKVLTVYYPNTTDLEAFDASHGFSGNYFQLRSEIRYNKPLKRALQGNNAWISTGFQGQLVDKNKYNYGGNAWIRWDSLHEIPSFNPMVRWTQEEIRNYARHHGLTLLNTQSKSIAQNNALVDEIYPAAIGIR